MNTPITSNPVFGPNVPNQTTLQLKELDTIEEDLVESLNSAGLALKEMTKEKVNGKQLEQMTSGFINRLERAATGLSQQISYLMRVSTSQSAESSSYGCRKDSRMAQSRLEHVQTRLRGLSSRLNNTGYSGGVVGSR